MKNGDNLNWHSGKPCFFLTLLSLLVTGAVPGIGMQCQIQAKCFPLQCTKSQDPNQLTVHPNSNITLNCSILRGEQPPVIMQWQNKTRGVIPGIGIQCQVQANCFPALQCSKSQDPNQLTLYPNSNMTLNCSILSGEQPPVIMWQSKTRLIHKSSLVLWNVQSTDGGQYNCTCNGTNHSDQRVIAEKVQKKPEITFYGHSSSSPQNVFIDRTEPKVLECSFSGWPIPSINWFQDNKPIVNGSRGFYVSDSHRGRSRLYISSFREGNYKCVANNTIGSSHRIIQLRVKCYKEAKVQAISQSTVRAERLSNITLECLIKLRDKCFKEPGHDFKLNWRLKGEILKNNSNVTISTQILSDCTRNFTLSILKLTEKDNGAYTCEIYCTATRDFQKTAINLEVFHTTVKGTNTLPPSKTSTTENESATGIQGKVKLLVSTMASCVGIAFIALVFIIFKLKRKAIGRKNYEGLDDVVADSLFISHSSRDLDWVTDNLIPLLDKHSINYTIHNRDFQLGTPIIQNMANSVYGSRKVLIVLSNNYLASNFCRAELCMAMKRESDTILSSLILVKIENLKKSRQSSALKQMTVLDFGKLDTKTWEEKIISKIRGDQTSSV